MRKNIVGGTSFFTYKSKAPTAATAHLPGLQQRLLAHLPNLQLQPGRRRNLQQQQPRRRRNHQQRQPGRLPRHQRRQLAHLVRNFRYGRRTDGTNSRGTITKELLPTKGLPPMYSTQPPHPLPPRGDAPPPPPQLQRQPQAFLMRF